MWVIVWLTRVSPQLVENDPDTDLAKFSPTTLPKGSRRGDLASTTSPLGVLRAAPTDRITDGDYPDTLSGSKPMSAPNLAVASRTATPLRARVSASTSVISTSSFGVPSPLRTDSPPEGGALSFPGASPIEVSKPAIILTATAAVSSATASFTVTAPTADRTTDVLPIIDISACPSPSSSPHLWFSRPFAPGANDWASTYYPYGSTAGGEYLLHHGVDMGNPDGTAVLATGSGTVLYAGDDLQRAMGPQPDFYGLLVLLEMDRKYQGEPVFTLYGHLSLVSVAVGQRVSEGSQLGAVGATGIAMGPHLHLEVRVVDAYDYGATRNPELWLRPHGGTGLIAGQVLDSDGEPLSEVRMALYAAENLDRPFREGWTYAGRGVNGDQELQENLVWGDVAAGDWIVIADLLDVRLRQQVTVRPGETSWVCLRSPAIGPQFSD
jgi:murein DD-endopeptidase MepM/ murein hydrolase activator NlpD